MRDVKLTHYVHGCSILAKTSQGRNKIFPKAFASWTARWTSWKRHKNSQNDCENLKIVDSHMAKPRTAPYGSWKSPITSDSIVGGSIGLTQPLVDGDNIYWIEMRPTEGGRNIIARRNSAGAVHDLTPKGFNARTRVHEYGGGDYTVSRSRVYFSNFSDQRLYVQEQGQEPKAITPDVSMRYADMVVDETRQRLICVREDHTRTGAEAANALVSLNLDSNEDAGIVLASGNDFYSSPKISRDGSRLAWLTWNHPNMPWDRCELWTARLDEQGLVSDAKKVAGGAEESIFQPEWSPDGVLYFVSDRSGWWNLYRQFSEGNVESVHEMEAEFGMPQWGFGMSSYCFESAEESSAHMLTVEYFVWRSSTLKQKILNPLKRLTPTSGMCGLRTAWPLCGSLRQLNLLRLSGSIVLPAPLTSCDVRTISVSTRDTFPFHRPLNFLPPETPRPTASFIVLRIVTITLPKRNARLC